MLDRRAVNVHDSDHRERSRKSDVLSVEGPVPDESSAQRPGRSPAPTRTAPDGTGAAGPVARPSMDGRPVHVRRRIVMRRTAALMAVTGAVLVGLVGCSSTSGAGSVSASNPDVKKAEAALASMSTG